MLTLQAVNLDLVLLGFSSIYMDCRPEDNVDKRKWNLQTMIYGGNYKLIMAYRIFFIIPKTAIRIVVTETFRV